MSLSTPTTWAIEWLHFIIRSEPRGSVKKVCGSVWQFSQRPLQTSFLLEFSERMCRHVVVRRLHCVALLMIAHLATRKSLWLLKTQKVSIKISAQDTLKCILKGLLVILYVDFPEDKNVTFSALKMFLDKDGNFSGLKVDRKYGFFSNLALSEVELFQFPKSL